MSYPTTPLRRVPLTGAGVRVVVRIRPMTESEKGCTTCAVYPMEQQPRAPPDSPSSSSMGTIDSQASTSSRSSFRLPKGVLSKIPRLRKHKRKKKTDDADGEDDSTPTPVACNTIDRQYFEDIPKICCAGSRQFEFDAVFGAEASQENVYNVIGDCVPQVLDGFNATILAYGMTGCGKSYTMMGNHDGVIARAIDDIFNGKESSDKDVSVTMSCLEIYTEELRDLLGFDESSASSASLKLRDNGDSVEVLGLRLVTVETADQVQQLLEKASLRRTTGSTRLNERSSRSHAIYTLFVTTKTGENVVKAKLTLVDLAGSERIKDSGVVGAQQKESININTDLFVLGKVVSALSDRSKMNGSATKAHHVPYRDSKLTRLLRDALGGNCRTVLIACVSPASIHTDESLNTLRYAERTRSIKNYAKQNILDNTVMTPAQCAALRAENRVLRARIANLTRRGATGYQSVTSFDSPPPRDMGAEFNVLEEKLQKAQALAQATRENCRKVASPEIRLKERYEKFENMKSSKVTENMLEERLPNSEMARQVQKDLQTLVHEKITLMQNLLNLFQQYEEKRDELNIVEEAFRKRNFSFHDTFEKEERKRNAAREEALQLQQSIRKVASGMKENEELVHTLLPVLFDGGTDYEERQPLEEKRVQGREIELRCKSLTQDVDFLNNENDILRGQNKSLQDEMKRLRGKLSRSEKSEGTDPLSASQGIAENLESPTYMNAADDAEKEIPSDHKKIRSHAEELLDWADRAIEKGRRSQDSTCGSSFTSTLGTDLKPSSLNMSGASRIERFRSAEEVASIPGKDNDENQFIISNIDKMDAKDDACPCQTSVFSNKPEHVEFYLPKLRVMCSCGRRQEVSLKSSDPCSLSNILRDWQIEFLASLDIHTAMDMVHANTQRSKILAKEMRRWRKKKGMLSVRTKSCRVALHIWTRTCKAVVKAVQEDKAQGGDGVLRPNFLDVSLASDNHTVSTLGFGGDSTADHVFGDDLQEEELI